MNNFDLYSSAIISSLDRRISKTGPGYWTKLSFTFKFVNSLTVLTTNFSAKLGIRGTANGAKSSNVASSI